MNFERTPEQPASAENVITTMETGDGLSTEQLQTVKSIQEMGSRYQYSPRATRLEYDPAKNGSVDKTLAYIANKLSVKGDVIEKRFREKYPNLEDNELHQ
ncbi:MAG: hypothetical protein O3A36_00070 [bacterium]|nr:hypothetical protein [bacterium]